MNEFGSGTKWIYRLTTDSRRFSKNLSHLRVHCNHDVLRVGYFIVPVIRLLFNPSRELIFKNWSAYISYPLLRCLRQFEVGFRQVCIDLGMFFVKVSPYILHGKSFISKSNIMNMNFDCIIWTNLSEAPIMECWNLLWNMNCSDHCSTELLLLAIHKLLKEIYCYIIVRRQVNAIVTCKKVIYLALAPVLSLEFFGRNPATETLVRLRLKHRCVVLLHR